MNSRKSLVSLRESASSVEDAASSAGLESGGSNSRPLRKRPRLSKRASMAEGKCYLCLVESLVMLTGEVLAG